MLNFFKKKPKEKLDCLGYYDTKQYHSFEYSLIYAKDIEIIKNEFVKVYARLYKQTILVIVLVDNEEGFDYTQYNYLALKDKIDEKITEAHDSVVNIIVFQNKNEKTISIAKIPLENTKKEINQILIYNEVDVRIEYYRPVPTFYQLYRSYAEALYFDLAAIDPTR